ncbi:tandem-95 repeat protein (plasmid) [Pseudomonas putida]|uniref:Ig-like domain-containing protein n=1 Tax=Pseudomonas putida TaxID=303 RepID=UPI001BB05A49|nr:Ig-like domain-containing protein [Pseudomonas putida]QUG93082.1 tandem-95 repeat protein [Pseudomonas putida]
MPLHFKRIFRGLWSCRGTHHSIDRADRNVSTLAVVGAFVFAMLYSTFSTAALECSYQRDVMQYRVAGIDSCNMPSRCGDRYTVTVNGVDVYKSLRDRPSFPYIVNGIKYTPGAQVAEYNEQGTSTGSNTYRVYGYQLCAEPLNSAPSVSDTGLVTAEDTSGAVALTAYDPDEGDFHSFTIVSNVNPAHGSAYVSGNTLVFTPRPDWYGTTSLTYSASDSQGAVSNVATVTITVTPVNDAPVAQPQSLATNEDITGAVTLSATDIDSPPPSVFQIVSAPNAAYGSAWISGSTLNFAPAANWSGTTSLTYIAQDNAGAWSAPATVSITVYPVNDAPVAQPTALTVNEDTSGAVTLTATDIDSPEPSVFQIVTAPNGAHGSASISGSTLTFTPAANWNGSTSLTFRAQDSSGAWSAPATVNITVVPVNDAPVAQPKTLTISEDTPGSVTLTATDIDSPTPTVFQIVTGPSAAHGTATISGSTLTFTPAANWNGSTSLTYRAQDSSDAWSAPVTVNITVVPVNDAPVAQPKSLTVNEDTQGSVTLTATDIDSPTPTVFQIVAGPSATHGTATISGSTLTFTPAANWNGSTSLTYRAQDSAGAWSAPATVNITVEPVNDAPVAQPKTLTINEDVPGSVTLTATDIDSPTPTVFQIVAGPSAAHGTASISGSTLTFKPALNWNGQTSLTYRAQDSAGAWSTPATLSITVNPINDVPVSAGVLKIRTKESQPVEVRASVGN